MFPFFFLSGRNDPKRKETLELDKGTMVGVNERLKREATSYPARVERKEDFFIFLFILPPHFGRPRSRSLLSSFIPYPLYLLYYPLFFTSLYILECTSKKGG